MHRYLAVAVLFGVLLCESDLQNQTTTAGPFFRKATLSDKVESGRELKERIEKILSRELFKKVLPLTNKELSKLENSADTTIALSAAWERVRRRIPKKESNQVYTPDKEALSRFLNFVAERTETSIPKGWEATVMSADARERGNIHYSWTDTLSNALENQNAQTAEEKQIQKMLMLVMGFQPEHIQKFDLRYPMIHDEGFVYVASCVPVPSFYDVFAIDQKTKEIIWESESWASSCLPDLTGSHWHHAELRTTQNTLIVFGSSNLEIYIEIFDKKTGKNLCRFSSAYLKDVE